MKQATTGSRFPSDNTQNGETISKKLHCYEQLINNRAVRNERASMCRNCPASKRDYGKALYERDQARKHLQIAHFRPEDVLKHDEADGMVIFLFSF